MATSVYGPPPVFVSPGSQQTGSANLSGEIQGRDFKAGGLTGATGASRYVGATASGAPVSGTFVIGDYIIDRTGKIYICTTAGSPGTWTVVSTTTSSGFLPISNTLLAAPAATITLSSIPQTYRHLFLVINGRSNAAGVNNVYCYTQFNGDTGAHYDWERQLTSNAATAPLQSLGDVQMPLVELTGAIAAANNPGGGCAWIYGYTGTVFNKTAVGLSAVSFGGGIQSQAYEFTGTWSSTTAITSILLFPDTGNFITGTTVDLYGIV